jgi:hypothetical protein
MSDKRREPRFLMSFQNCGKERFQLVKPPLYTRPRLHNHPNFPAKSVIASEMPIRCGQTASQFLHPTKLFLKDRGDFIHVGQIVSGKFVRKTIAVAGIFARQLPENGFRTTAVIAPCGVVAVHSMLHGASNHFLRLRLVDFRLIAVASSF